MNSSRILKLFLVIVVTLLVEISASQSAWGGYQEGLDANKRGDYATALKEFQPLAEQGNAKAQFNLGFMYEYGLGVPKDYTFAVKWYRKSAEQGNALASLVLSSMYGIGNGVPKDEKLMFKWLRKSAEQGSVVAQFSLGMMYAKGEGVPTDNVLAHMWFNLSAANGEGEAIRVRDIFEKKMTPQQIAEAQRLSRDWIKKHKK